MEINHCDDNFFMNEALKEAQKAFYKDEVPVGCVIVCDGKIIARAHNYCEMLCDSTAHAEMQAITSASDYLGSKYLNECTLYVTLEPCIMCAGALFWSQLGKLVYASKDNKRGFNIHSKKILHPKTEILDGIMSEKCAKLLKDFFKQKR